MCIDIYHPIYITILTAVLFYKSKNNSFIDFFCVIMILKEVDRTGTVFQLRFVGSLWLK